LGAGQVGFVGWWVRLCREVGEFDMENWLLQGRQGTCMQNKVECWLSMDCGWQVGVAKPARIRYLVLLAQVLQSSQAQVC
jgi:beta-lactamase class D